MGHRDCPGHLEPPTPNNRQSSADRPTPPPPPPPSQFFWAEADQTTCCLSCWRQVRRLWMADGCSTGKVSGREACSHLQSRILGSANNGLGWCAGGSVHSVPGQEGQQASLYLWVASHSHLTWMPHSIFVETLATFWAGLSLPCARLLPYISTNTLALGAFLGLDIGSHSRTGLTVLVGCLPLTYLLDVTYPETLVRSLRELIPIICTVAVVCFADFALDYLSRFPFQLLVIYVFAFNLMNIHFRNELCPY